MNIEDMDIETDDDIEEIADDTGDIADDDDGDDLSADDDQDAGGDDDGEIVIEIEGEESDGKDDTPAIRQLREANRTQARRIAELESKGKGASAIEVGEKPTLEGCEYDEERFETELTAWQERKRVAEREKEAEAENARKSAELWNGIESKYRAAAVKLGVPEFEAKEKKVDETLPEIVRRAIKAYCDEPAKVIAALGTNPALLDRIAGEKDPIKQLVTLVKLEGKMTVKRTRQIQPDKPLSGSAPLEQVSKDKQLAKLEKEAEQTGDRTKLIAFRRAMKAKAA